MTYSSHSRTDGPRSIRYYLSERFRLRFEDAGLDEMLAEQENQQQQQQQIELQEALDASKTDDLAPETNRESHSPSNASVPMAEEAAPAANHDHGVVRTLDGDVAGDEFASDALNYQILLGKIDALLDSLRLDA